VEDIKLDCGLMAASLTTDVSFENGGGAVSFRGVGGAVNEAREQITALVQDGRARYCILVPHIREVSSLSSDSELWDRVRLQVRKHEAKRAKKDKDLVFPPFVVSPAQTDASMEISLSGDFESVLYAKHAVLSMLSQAFPSYFRSLPVPQRTLRESAGYDAQAPGVVSRAFISLVEEETGARLLVDRRRGRVYIAGDVIAAQLAQEQIQGRVEEWAERNATIQLTGDWIFPILIGKRGARVKEIQAKCVGVKIDMDRENMAILISGEPEAVAQATQEIKRRIEHAEASRQVRETVEVPTSRLAELIGQKGASIRKIQSTSGARVDVGSRGPEFSSVTVKGGKKAVDIALELIKRQVGIIDDDEADDEGSGRVRHEMVLGDDSRAGRLAALIIGRGGETVRSISNDTETRIKISPSGSSVRTVVVTGSEEAVATATARVLEVLRKSDIPCEDLVFRELPRGSQASTSGGAKQNGVPESSVPVGAPNHPKALKAQAAMADDAEDSDNSDDLELHAGTIGARVREYRTHNPRPLPGAQDSKGADADDASDADDSDFVDEDTDDNTDDSDDEGYVDDAQALANGGTSMASLNGAPRQSAQDAVSPPPRPEDCGSIDPTNVAESTAASLLRGEFGDDNGGKLLQMLLETSAAFETSLNGSVDSSARPSLSQGASSDDGLASPPGLPAPAHLPPTAPKAKPPSSAPPQAWGKGAAAGDSGDGKNADDILAMILGGAPAESREPMQHGAPKPTHNGQEARKKPQGTGAATPSAAPQNSGSAFKSKSGFSIRF